MSNIFLSDGKWFLDGYVCVYPILSCHNSFTRTTTPILPIMGKRKRTPTKRTLTKQLKRSRGRPRKERPKLTAKRRAYTPISNADRMAIVLLANAGKTASEISSMVGCSYNAAVNTLLVQRLVFCFFTWEAMEWAFRRSSTNRICCFQTKKRQNSYFQHAWKTETALQKVEENKCFQT